MYQSKRDVRDFLWKLKIVANKGEAMKFGFNQIVSGYVLISAVQTQVYMYFIFYMIIQNELFSMVTGSANIIKSKK